MISLTVTLCTAEFILEGKHPNETRGGSGDGEEISSFTPLPMKHMDRPGPWQSESLLASSWSTIEDADTQSLGSSDSGTAADEEEEGPEIEHRGEEPVISGLSQFSVEMEEDIQAPQTQELLVSAEEPHIETESAEFMHVVPPMALPPLPILQLDPPSNSSTPVHCTSAGDPEELLSTPLGLHPPSILTPMSHPTVKTAVDDPELSQKHSIVISSEWQDT
ncbi:uncharacterized protein LOC129411454 isoform X2 [Boleophthalmus pectinirostris]|uniref:uncharacterized protein LOC129411454 isoform X2 n=1 Tax=Boleophthalmus pectinirostris TaxID=150288 RepID=UPI0024323A9F|nr:uncharacterized protein LOC129411454 isoform X2 [Boleophthalmus pectinirostris]